MLPTSDRETSRARLALTVLMVAALVAGAGCTGALDGSSGGAGSADPATDAVPENANAIAFVDVAGGMSDDTLRGVANHYLSLQAESGFGESPSTVEEAVAQMENGTELDVSGLEGLTMFSHNTGEARLEGPVNGEYSAVIVQSSWSESELVSAIESNANDELEESTYAGATIYQSNTDDSYLGVLGDGRFVAGTESAVTDALDVEAGNADAASGDVVSAFEDTEDGYVRFASTVEEGQVPTEQLDQSGAVSNANIFNEVTLLSGAHYVDGDQIGIEMTMATGDSDTALNLRDVLQGAASWGRNTVEGTEGSAEIAGLIDRDSLSVEQSGSDVTVTSTNSADEIETLIDLFYGTAPTA